MGKTSPGTKSLVEKKNKGHKKKEIDHNATNAQVLNNSTPRVAGNA